MKENAPSNPNDVTPPPLTATVSPNNFSERDTDQNNQSMDQSPGIWMTLETLLKNPRQLIGQLNRDSQGRLISSLLFILIPCLIVYGIVMGSFNGGMQLWIAPLKMVLGTLLSALICLPSLYIFACLNGTNVKLSGVVGLLFGALTLSSLLLIGFAPVVWLFSQSTQSLVFMGWFHFFVWMTGTYFAITLISTGMKIFHPSSTFHLKIWGVIFLLVSLQMSTAIRPLIGKADTFLPQEKKFFLAHWYDCMK